MPDPPAPPPEDSSGRNANPPAGHLSAEEEAVRHVTEYFRGYATKAGRGSGNDPHDVAQEVWVRWVERCRTTGVDPQATAHEFYLSDSEARRLLQSVVREAVERGRYLIRRRPHRLRRLIDLFRRRQPASDLVQTVEVALDVAHFTRSLPGHERVVFELLAGGFTQAVIAARLGLPKQTLSDRVRQVRQKFKEFLKRREDLR